MSVVTLAEAKQHLRVTSNDEDALIELYVGAAMDHIKKYLNREPPVTFAIKAAALLIMADLYENREAQLIGDSVNENPAVYRLLFPYRDRMGV